MTGFPDWLEPMAATLTQERFTGPEWVFERKLDGIRLLAFKQRRGRAAALAQPAAAERAYPGRRRRRSPRCRCATRSSTARRPASGARRARSATTCSTCCGSTAATSRRCRSTSAARCSSALPLAPPLRARRARSTTPSPWERACARGLGGRDRQAARLALRAPALAALAEDEVRGQRRSWWSAASPTRRAAASASARCSSATSTATTSCSPARSAPASTRKLLLELRARLDALEIAAPPFTRGDRPAAPARALGAARGRGAGRVHRVDRSTASCAIRACSACATTRRRARSCGRRP